jgi:superfamily II DNA or RNA helicase
VPASLSVPEIGDIITIRQRTYLVEDVCPPSVPKQATLCKLSCVDDDAQGQSLEVLWQHELDGQIIGAEQWDKLGARGFDQSEIFAAYLNTLRWNCVTATDPRLFQSPFRAGISIEPYQLEPLRKALLLPRVNLFIADDVGLGKTIESGLIARELLLRKKARDIVVCCPPSMLLQWKEEMETRFGLIFEILDRQYLAKVRQERGFAVNPWSTHTRFLFSSRLLIDEAYTAPLRDWLGELRPASLLILDEAHHAAPSSGRRYAIDSKITRAMRDIAPRFEHRLFLSATPHNGHSNSFSALLEILDPQRFCRGVRVRKSDLDAVMVRRLKEDIREAVGGFAKRQVVQIDITDLPPDSPELRLPELLDQYRQLREQRLTSESKRCRAASALLITGLQQRLLSSVEAFSRTLRVHRATVLRQWNHSQSINPAPHAAPHHTDESPDAVALANLDPVAADDDRAELHEEQLWQEEESLVATATAQSAGTLTAPDAKALFARELELLEAMAGIADTARQHPDARIKHLLTWMNRCMCPQIGQTTSTATPWPWSDLRIIIFTEFDDTKRYIERQLRAAIAGDPDCDNRIAIFHGPTPPEQRELIKRAFNSDPRENPLRILIATDAAREGLNLQAHCWNLFHFDVPWNPARMEQRNGRIDRKLQPRPEVFCHYFFYHQRPEDRVLQVLVRKTTTIREELGSFSAVLEGRLAGAIKSGIRRNAIDQAVSEIQSADLPPDQRQSMTEELEDSRLRKNALKEQIEALSKYLENSRRRIGFDENHFHAAIASSLKIAGAPPLEPVADHPGEFAFPPMDCLRDADPTWAAAMDSLRQPKPPAMNSYQWRASSPPRPIVFRNTGTLSEETVHFHLDQRVVQRLLGRFRSQGFIHHDISRCCLTHTADRVPRIMLLGRLCLYGNNAARLHEELIFVAARWEPPATRSGPLAPYARDAEDFTLQLLNDTLTIQSAESPNPTPTSPKPASLLAALPRDVRDLMPHLHDRATAAAARARTALQNRGEAEAAAMLQILQDQQKRISRSVEQHQSHDSGQLNIVFDESERRQLEADHRYWTKRLASLDREIAEQPKRITDLYQIQAQRIEPVGVVYLLPGGA